MLSSQSLGVQMNTCHSTGQGNSTGKVSLDSHLTQIGFQTMTTSYQVVDLIYEEAFSHKPTFVFYTYSDSHLIFANFKQHVTTVLPGL